MKPLVPHRFQKFCKKIPATVIAYKYHSILNSKVLLQQEEAGLEIFKRA